MQLANLQASGIFFFQKNNDLWFSSGVFMDDGMATGTLSSGVVLKDWFITQDRCEWVVDSAGTFLL